ncbi:MAG: hypothetical protein U0Y10_09095 [Spirosomataceae bacterium]
MLPIFSKITEISQVLDKELKRSISDYKIFVRLNIELDIYIKAPQNSPIESIVKPYAKGFKINILVYDDEEVENDPFLEHIFTNNSEKVNYGLKYRFHSLLDDVNTVQEGRKLPPVVTFYSYKGGMGRTTTLASFASYYAMHYKKKVVMIDCDLEAPGFNNFFDLSAERLENRSGFVEYLIDKQAQDTSLDLENYILEVDKDFSGEGTIYVMPAGNVSTNPISDAPDAPTHLQHYLEALARIDIANEYNFSNAFQDLIGEIDKKYQPDVILIDSRTGFNDIFGIAAFDLSELVVGFFGSSEQTLPGLYYFLDYTLKIQKKFDVVLANSILPMGDKRGFKTFTKTIDDIIAEKIQGLDQVPSFQSFPVTRYPLLERIGIDADSRESFVQIIADKDFSDYNQIFEGIIAKLDIVNHIQGYPDEKVDDSFTEKLIEEKVPSEPVIINKPLKQPAKYDPTKFPSFAIGLRKKLLNSLNKDSPKPYADDTSFDEEFISKKFYFRPKIYNVFNPDKFLIIGGKGTGKTLFYQGLRDDFFVKNLKEKAEKQDDFFLSTGAINLQQDPDKDRIFVIHTHFNIEKIINYDLYFQRFWLVYVWNVIMIDIRKGKYLSNSEFAKNTVPDILDDTSTKQRLETIINDDNQMIRIEEELKQVDSLLKNEEKHLMVLFDQLDFVCKPIYWDKVIAPFVSYWRSNRYNRILPKIFLRTDLFNKLGNITNKQQLKSQSIDLEWTQEEIYAFFFKWILSTTSSEFYNLMRTYKDYPSTQIDEIQSVTIKNHVPTESKYLEPLVSTFFGKFADKGGTAKFGTSYDWFYNNLKNADNTISLRPFIDLVWEGIGEAVKEAVKKDDNSSKPILPPRYFIVPEIRTKAVIRHFKDLAQEEGNMDLQVVYNHIFKLAPGHPLKKIYLKKREFDSLMADIIEKNPSIENKEVDKLKDLLIVNGIVAEIPVSGAYLNYRFAFLYKYFLGLK